MRANAPVRSLVVFALVAASAAAVPGRASAHVGRTAPVATSYIARVTGAPQGVEARIVDGDQRLWLRVGPGLAVTVIGFQGEPYLDFSVRGVAVNEHSPAYYLNRGRPVQVPRGLDPHAQPRWRPITSGHTYSWHEDRLHALAVVARRPGTRLVGQWRVPLRIDGRGGQVAGTLSYAPNPSLVWFWPIAVVIVSLVALLRLRSVSLDEATMAVLVTATLAAFLVGRAGRDLYGRPDVSVRELVGLSVTCALVVAAAALFALKDLDTRTFLALLVGVAGLNEGLSLIGTLLHGFVLSGLPAPVERAAAATCLAAGAGLMLLSVASEASLAGTGDRRPALASRRPPKARGRSADA